MKQIKGSIVVLAVAAAFAGSVTAQTTGPTIDSCRALDGFNDFVNKGTSSGVWDAVSSNKAQFTSNKMVASCSVPKNRNTLVTVDGPMTADECGMLNTLGSVDSKLNAAKVGDAYTSISAMIGKIDTLVSQNKLTHAGRDAIKPKALELQVCIQGLL